MLKKIKESLSNNSELKKKNKELLKKFEEENREKEYIEHTKKAQSYE